MTYKGTQRRRSRRIAQRVKGERTTRRLPFAIGNQVRNRSSGSMTCGPNGKLWSGNFRSESERRSALEKVGHAIRSAEYA